MNEEGLTRTVAAEPRFSTPTVAMFLQILGESCVNVAYAPNT